MELPSNREFHTQDIFEEKELKRLIKKHGTAFMGELLKEDLSSLKLRLAGMAKHRYHLQEFPKTKKEIKEAKEVYDEFMAPFRSQLLENGKKTKLINKVLQCREEEAGIES